MNCEKGCKKCACKSIEGLAEDSTEISIICQFCKTDPAEPPYYILCKECLVGNEMNLLLKCRKCNSNSTLYNMQFDNIGIVSTRLRSSKSKLEDLIFTGTGFLLMTDECPDCEIDRIKREKVKDEGKSFWEQVGVDMVID